MTGCRERIESSVISPQLVAGLRAAGARVLAVHVTAASAVIGERLRTRGQPSDARLAAQFERGLMDPAIFAPPAAADAVVRIDTSAGGEPAVEAILAVLRAYG